MSQKQKDASTASQWQELEACNQRLNAIHRIDRIRDQTTDSKLLLMRVADILAETVQSDLCMIGLQDKESVQVTLRAVNDRIKVMSRLDQQEIQHLLDSSTSLQGTAPVSPPPSFAANGLAHLLAVPLIAGDERVGVFILANATRAFSPADMDMAQAIGNQTDSAIVHLRTFEAMQERTKQLEAIYRIDRIRDQTNDIQELLAAISTVIVSSLSADLCLMSLTSEESGKSELKTVQDRHHVFGKLDRQAIEQTIDWAAHNKGVAALAQNSPLAAWDLRCLMGAPLVVAGDLLGSLVLARVRQPFLRQEQDLLGAIISQADSAIVQARMASRLEQRNKELETLYRVDKIRDQGLDFGAMLSAVLGELCSAIEAEMGFIMLFDQEGRQLELKASTADDMLASSGHYKLIEQAANHALSSGQLYAAERLDNWLDSLMCIPLILRDKIIGVFGAVNRRRPGSFSTDDKRLLLAITSQVDTAIFESMEQRHIRETFQRYVNPNVVEQLLTMTEKDFLKGERTRLSVLFSDIRGFTSISERIDPNIVVEMLNQHLGAMTEIVMDNNGTLDKFVGDEIVAIYGAPLPIPEHTYQAIKTAMEMQAAHQELMSKWAKRGYTLPPIGIGINTDDMFVGNIGCAKQMNYTVIGDAVNLASRLCGAAVGGQTLITDSTYELVADRILADKLPPIRVKNKEQPIHIYQVTGLRN